MTSPTNDKPVAVWEQLHRCIIENQSLDGSIDISDQSAMAYEILAIFTAQLDGLLGFQEHGTFETGKTGTHGAFIAVSVVEQLKENLQ